MNDHMGTQLSVPGTYSGSSDGPCAVVVVEAERKEREGRSTKNRIKQSLVFTVTIELL